ncbi:MAG: 3-methyl-2-oxobutanoate dehydrogenase subunit VorB [Clostridiales bacterium]|jgi:2-oxoglutarate ferredoxin oxidoreductase subunit alpha|nr:3-methyl-2-oxobutanoate dehydrogenase subunit VorB [Clostridiales bacterium]
MARQLIKGNEAIAEAAVRSGCRYYFGYPITPQSEIPEYMSARLSEVGGTFIQAESEISAINMVYGAAAAGGRAMTSSSSPGISLKQEGISYIAASDVPCVIVNVMRAGPGLGGIQPSQGDYFQAVKGGGHGDYKLIVYAPSSVQEAADYTYKAFDVADKYRIPVMILCDGLLGQMMEGVELPPMRDLSALPKKDWALRGWDRNGPRRIINSLRIQPDELERYIDGLYKKYDAIRQNEIEVEEYLCDDAEIILAAYGIVARICKGAILKLRKMGIKAGLIRPITLFPFPEDTFAMHAEKGSVKKFVSVELSKGQMIEDVRLAIGGKKPVAFYGRTGGNVMNEDDVASFIAGGK